MWGSVVTRGTLIFWISVTGATVLCLAVLAALGGFAAAETDRTAEPGERIRLERWQLVVDRAAYTNQSLAGFEQDPAIRVWLRITNVSAQTECCLLPRQVMIRFGDHSLAEPGAAYGTARQEPNYDPDIEVVRPFDFDYDGPPPDRITVIIRDDVEADNLVFDDQRRLSARGIAVDLPCPDRRTAGT